MDLLNYSISFPTLNLSQSTSSPSPTFLDPSQPRVSLHPIKPPLKKLIKYYDKSRVFQNTWVA
jgi:hypothetical protein